MSLLTFSRSSLLLMIFLHAVPCRADLVYLKNGGVLEGSVRKNGDKIQIVMADGTITIAASKVDRIVKKATTLDEFETRFAAIKTDADGATERYTDLGKWCKENRLKSQAKRCFQKAIEVGPENTRARAELGYEKYQGKWMKSKEVQQARGFVKHKGTWVSPEAKEDLVRMEASTKLEKVRAAAEALKLERAQAETQTAQAQAEAALAAAQALRENLYQRYTQPIYPVYIYRRRSRHFISHDHTPAPLCGNRLTPVQPGDKVEFTRTSPLGVPTLRADESKALLRVVTPASGLGVPVVSVVPAAHHVKAKAAKK